MTETEPWWEPDAASIGSGAAPVDGPPGYTQPDAHAMLTGDINAVEVAQFRHESCLRRAGLGNLAGKLNRSVLLPWGPLFDAGASSSSRGMCFWIVH